MTYELNRPADESAMIMQSPIYFSGGFGYDEERNNGVLRYMQALGHKTIPALPDQEPAIADPRFTVTVGGLNAVISRNQAMRLVGSKDIESISANYQQARAETLIAMLEQNGYGGVRAIFQSADALNGLKVMYEKPSLIGHVVLAYPAGIISQPRFLKAARGVFKSGLKARPNSNVTAADNFEIREDGSKIRRSRAASNFVVAASVALSDQGSLLPKIRGRNNPPGISLVLGLQDWMIRPERVIASLRSPTDVDYILITDKPHGVNGRKDEIHEWLELFSLMAKARAAHAAGVNATEPLANRMIFFGDISQKKQDELLALAAKVDTVA